MKTIETVINPEDVYDDPAYVDYHSFGYMDRPERIELDQHRPRNEFEHVPHIPRMDLQAGFGERGPLDAYARMERLVVENIRIIFKEWVKSEHGRRGYFREYVTYMRIPQIGNHERHLEDIVNQVASGMRYEFIQERQRVDQRWTQEYDAPKVAKEPERRTEQHFEENLFDMEKLDEL